MMGKLNNKMIYIAPDLLKGALGAGKTFPNPHTPKKMRQIHNNNIA
jgi:hypothetical protein